jgi:uncharacterized membrane protein YdfJ with MMPL/SSD domain
MVKKVKGLSRPVGILVVSVMALSILGCVAAIPVAVVYYKDQQKYHATAEIPVLPDKVYAAAVSLAEEKELKIVKKDDANRIIVVTDGKQTASLSAKPLGDDKTEVAVVADIPEAKERKEEQKELAMRVIDKVCERLGVTYTVTKQ